MVGDSGIVAQLEKAARRYAVWAWINVGIAVLGGLATLASYNATGTGGQYVAFKGAIVLGPVFAIINTVRYFRTRSRVRELKASVGAPRASGQQAPPHPQTPRAAPASANGPRSGKVYNPPPGWPRPPEGWVPGPDWRPDPSWPGRPQRWNLLVDPEFLMKPRDLSEDLDFGPPARVTKKQLKEASLGAADAIAWQICQAAGVRNENPLVTMEGVGEHIRTATAKAKDRVFSKLIAETNEWVRSTQGNIHEWEAALQHARMILDKKDAFDGLVEKRIRAVIVAAVAPPLQEPEAPRPAPRPAPEFIRTAPLSEQGQSRKPAKKDKALGDRDFIIGSVVVGIIVLAVAYSAFQYNANTSGTAASGTAAGNSQPVAAAAAPAADPKFDATLVAKLDGQIGWHRNGDFYAQWVPNGTYACSAGTVCTELYVQTPLIDGCKSVDVVVDMLKNGTVLGSYHGGYANMPKGSQRKMHIQGASPGATPDTVELNRITCMS
jgi:hypothetical protein